jgi:Ca-activated chloride channel family protein
MRIGGRMTNAKLGAHQLIDILNDDDSFSLLSFSDKPVWVEKGAKLDKNRAEAHKQIDSLFPAGETALYDSIAQAYQHIQEAPQASTIQAIVVLTDGEDNKSKLKLEELLDKIKIDYEKKPVRVFTIAYGSGTDKSNLPDVTVLKKIADATQAKSYEGKPETIRNVLKDIATFF